MGSMLRLTPYAASVAPMTRKQKNAAARRIMLAGDSFHLFAAAEMAGVGQGSEPPFSPRRDALPEEDGTCALMMRRGS